MYNNVNVNMIISYINESTLPITKYIEPTNIIIDTDIPLDIYLTWHTKVLPPYLKYNLDIAIKNNPEFKFNIYDVNDCRTFIQNNFDDDVLHAYDSLKPIAFNNHRLKISSC